MIVFRNLAFDIPHTVCTALLNDGQRRFVYLSDSRSVILQSRLWRDRQRKAKTRLAPDERDERRFKKMASSSLGDRILLLCSQWTYVILPVGNPMKEKTDVLQGTLALMVPGGRRWTCWGRCTGYGIARRIEQDQRGPA